MKNNVFRFIQYFQDNNKVEKLYIIILKKFDLYKWHIGQFLVFVAWNVAHVESVAFVDERFSWFLFPSSTFPISNMTNSLPVKLAL